MRKNEYQIWIEDVKAYWRQPSLVQRYYANDQTLLSEISANISSEVISKVDSYFSNESAKLDEFKDVLPSLYGYISQKYLMEVLAEDAPSIQDLIPSGKFTSLYGSFSVDLSSIDYSSWFFFEDILEPDPSAPIDQWVTKMVTVIDPETGITSEVEQTVPPETFQGNGKLIVSSSISILDGLLHSGTTASSFYSNFVYQIWPATRDRTIFSMFRKPMVRVADIEVKDFMLEDMELKEVLEDLGWVIPGLDID